MLTIITICLAVLTFTVLLVGIYLVFVLSSLKKTTEEIGELVSYIKGELIGLRSPIERIKRLGRIIDEVSQGLKSVKSRIILPFAFILGICAGIKAGLNVFLKGGDKDGE